MTFEKYHGKCLHCDSSCERVDYCGGTRWNPDRQTMKEEISSLQSQLKVMREALEFYADIQGANDEWQSDGSETLFMRDFDDFELVDWKVPNSEQIYRVRTLGKLARQALKEVGE